MSGRVITFGEVMLRLKSPGHERFPGETKISIVRGTVRGQLQVGTFQITHARYCRLTCCVV
jgi:hypothetical protein